MVGTSIVDFMAPARKLIVEVDGGYHRDPRRQRADARRDKRLARGLSRAAAAGGARFQQPAAGSAAGARGSHRVISLWCANMQASSGYRSNEGVWQRRQRRVPQLLD